MAIAPGADFSAGFRILSWLFEAEANKLKHG
jgi:hypothetical protein